MSGFDKLAKAYRWMEYMSFGGKLQRCRTHFLQRVRQAKLALVLGDGDGRFLSALLRSNDDVHAVAVDSSATMLQTLLKRCGSSRVTTVHADMRQGLPGELTARCYDLVATHFFLDCLHDEEVTLLVDDVTARIAPDCQWIISEFRVPDRGAMRWPAWLMVRWLYVAFGLLTGLEVRRLPSHVRILQDREWEVSERQLWLGGLLTSELWTRQASGSLR